MFGDFVRRGPPKTTIKDAGKMGLGLFAKGDIPRGTVVGEYTGVIKPEPPGSKRNGYLFQWGPTGQMNRRAYVIDALKEGNETRFINHSARNPNLQPLAVFHGANWHIVFVTTRKIAKSEQLLFDYGKGYWSGRDKPVE